MRPLRAIAIASVLAVAGTAHADVPLTEFLQVLGNVTNSARPVANALVIALNINSLDAFETFTANDGQFSLPPLRAGVYKIVALKRGFVPATAVVLPTQKDLRVALKLNAEKPNAKDVNQTIWELRATVPPDILRDIEMTIAPQQAASPYDIPRIRGEMVSMTGVTADQSSNNVAFAQTALGVQSRLNDNWQIGFRGNLHRIDDPTEGTPFSAPLAESSAMQMELRSSPTEAYRLASTRSWWRYRDNNDPDRSADVRSNNFEWEHGPAHIQVRYFAQQNVFQVNPLGSELVEIAGNATILQTRRSDIAVSMRVSQETLRGNVTGQTVRTADVATNASLEVAAPLVLRYGMASRVGLEGAEWAPRTGFDVRLAKDASIVVTGQYKVLDQRHATIDLPSTVLWSEEGYVLPHYAYSVGIVTGDENTNRFSAIASVTAVDAPLRVMIADGSEQFWDGVYVDRGDVRRDVRVAFRHEIGRGMAIDVSTCAGMASPRNGTAGGRKIYVTGDVQSTYRPTGTSVAVSYRQIQQPQAAAADYRSERVNVHMAQSLHLPLDLKVLLGLELAHAENSPFMLDTFDPEGTVSRRYIGGLAVNF